MRSQLLSFTVATALAAALSPLPADACASAPREGEAVRIDDEMALIVWDPASKIEHFIRSASFSTTAADFGFLVPTPSKPELAEVDSGIMWELVRHTQPEQIPKRKGIRVEPGCGALMFLNRSVWDEGVSSAVAVAPPAVRVLDEKQVANYEVAVLEADSATALSEWLKNHGYVERATLTEWLRPYVAQKWKITAFKIAPRRPMQAFSTSAVRMSFTTERPFYPYREPSDQRETVQAKLPEARARRTLNVFFIGPGRFDGTIGEAGPAWPGRPRWSQPYKRTMIPQRPWPFTLPENAWLTNFEDTSSPRPGTDDVFFSPTKDQSPIVPPPIVAFYTTRVPVPLELVLVAGVGVFLVVRKIIRKKAAKSGT